MASALSGVALLVGGLSSCLNEPDYSTTPEIGFEKIRVGRAPAYLPGVTPPQVDPQGIPTDTVLVTIRYQDGDGDLGLSQTEKKTTFRNDSINYFIQPLLKNVATRKYEPILNTAPGIPAGTYLNDNGSFDHLTTLTDSKAAPLKGMLVRKLFYPYGSPFVAGQTVRFQISIVDRARHRSNVITTDSIVVARR